MSMSERIDELKGALQSVEQNFELNKKKLQIKAALWIGICITGLSTGTYLSYQLLCIDLDKYHHLWTWEIIYYTAIRLMLSGVFISLMAFCFKMLRSYMHMAEHNRHKLTIIKSMAYLVGAGKNQEQRDIVFNSLTQMITDFGNIGIISQDSDFKNSNTFIEMADKALKKG